MEWREKMAEDSIKKMIIAALDGADSIADAKSVIGDPIQTPSGTTIIPVSRVSIGIASGGLDYHPKSKQKNKDSDQKVPSKNAQPCFGGGGGTGITLTPVGFLIIYQDGRVEMLDIVNPAAVPAPVGVIDSITNLADKAPDIITRIKSALSKDKKPESGMDDKTIEEILKDDE